MPAIPTFRPRRRRWVAAAITGCALAIAACGSTGAPSGTVTNAGSAGHSGGAGGSALAFAVCMRSHGVPDFPDPSGGGGVNLPANLNPASPAFEAARATCMKKLPGGGPPAPSGAATAHFKAQMLATSECMRAHGVTDFPDPTVGRPPSNPAGYGIVEDAAGVVIAVPSSINPSSPAFKQAGKACNFG